MFITNYVTGTIGEFTTSGGTVNPSLVSGLREPYGIAVTSTPEPSTLALFAAGAIGLVGYVQRRRRATRASTKPAPVAQQDDPAILSFPSHSSPVTVNAGGVLGGSGTLSSVSVSASGAITPGSPLGTMTISGSLSLVVGAMLDYELDSPLGDTLSCGSLVLSSPLEFSDFVLTPTANFAPGTYELITSGAPLLSGVLDGNNSGTIDGLPATLSLQSNDLVLTVVPEASTATLLGACVVGLMGWTWRRRIGKVQLLKENERV